MLHQRKIPNSGKDFKEETKIGGRRERERERKDRKKTTILEREEGRLALDLRLGAQ